MRRFISWLQKRWYAPRLFLPSQPSPLSSSLPSSLLFLALLFLLLPLSLLFIALSGLRRLCYRQGFLAITHLPVPVIVIGNITVGGTGKTPLTLALAQSLREAGWKPGIVSRGYGGSHALEHAAPRPVPPNANPLETGDEPLLLALRSQLPVWIGRDRAAAGAALLAAHPDVNVILCDDGLQHYRLARDVEIAVFDKRGTGNGFPLPAGPLRELPSRLDRADFIVTHGDSPPPEIAGLAAGKSCVTMTLEADNCYRLSDPSERCPATDFRGQKLHAIAGIGHPARFFATLEDLGLDYIPHAFPDHHPYRADDLAFPDDNKILMTEKDGVKCAHLTDANLSRVWVLPVSARIGVEFNAEFIAALLKKLS